MWLKRLQARFTMAMPDAGIRLLGRLQARVLRVSRGRLAARYAGAPLLVLTTTGRRSGQPRSTSVMYGRDGDDLVVIGSNTGSERPPAWALNLEANPEASVLVRGRERAVRARRADPEHEPRLWSVMSGTYVGFDMYRERTTRELRVFVLEPA